MVSRVPARWQRRIPDSAGSFAPPATARPAVADGNPLLSKR